MKTSRQSITRNVKEYIKIRVFEGEVDCVLTFFYLKKEVGVLEKDTS